MPKVYCLHHWITSTKKIRECTICGERWHHSKDKEPPNVAIGVLPDYAPVFSSNESDQEFVKDAPGIRNKTPVYCNHMWETFGPDTMRCMRCRNIWKKFKHPEEPQVVIGYSESPTS